MAAIISGAIGSKNTTRWLPWVLLAVVALYFVGYVDGSVHAASFGAAGAKMGYVHEFFHHARHVALMCH